MKLVWLLALILVPPARSVLVNVTIDNKYGDPRTGTQFIFSPNGAWYDGPGCTTCRAQPDPNQAYNGTWVDSTFNSQLGSNPFPGAVPTASINFTGSAIYVYCIMAYSISPSFLTFLLDGQVVGSFYGGVNEQQQNTTVPSRSFDYNVLVYSNKSLIHGTHSFMLKNGFPNGPLSLVLLDYLTYSTNDLFAGPPNPGGNPLPGTQSTVATKSSRGWLLAIIFGTIGGLLFVILAAILCHHLAQRGFFSKMKAPSWSFKLPSMTFRFPSVHRKLPPIRLFHRRSVIQVKPVDPPTFSPSRLVQRIAPEPPPSPSLLDDPPPHRFSPARNQHNSLPTPWHDVPLVPRRRGDAEGDGFRFFSAILQSTRRNSSVIPAMSHQHPTEPSHLDITSHDLASLSEDSRPPTPPPMRNSRPPRRLTVRNI